MEPFSIIYWLWWLFAIVMVFLEVAAGTGFVLIFIGAGAAIVGIITYLFPDIIWTTQMLWFTFSVLGTFFGWRFIGKFFPNTADTMALNQRAARYVGRIVTLDTPIADGKGNIWVDHLYWPVFGPDLPVGVKVKVIAADETHLVVEEYTPEEV